MSEMGPPPERTSYSREWAIQHYASPEGPAKIAARQLYYSCLGRERRGEEPFYLEDKTIESLYVAGLSPDDTLVDIGCAFPGFLLQLEQMGHRGNLIGVEPNTAQLGGLPFWQAGGEQKGPDKTQLRNWHDLARLTLQPPALEHPNLMLLGATAGHIPLEDSFANAVTSMFMFYHIDKDHQSQTLDELRRILKPEGLFALTTRGRHNKQELCQEEANIADALIKIMGENVHPPAPTNSGFTAEDALELLPRHFAHTYRFRHQDTIKIDDSWSADIVVGNLNSLRDLFTTDVGRAPTPVQFSLAVTRALGPRLNAIRKGEHIMTDTWDESLFICSDRQLDLPGFEEIKPSLTT